MKKSLIKDFSLEQQREFIASIAGYYSSDRHSNLGNIRNELEAPLQYFNGGKILEIGCAGGAVLKILQEKGLPAIGIDVVPEMIQQAKQHDLSNLILADGTSLPFDDNSVEMVFIWGNTLGPIPGEENRQQILNEAFRVLSHSGCLAINVINRTNSIIRIFQPKEYLFHYNSRSVLWKSELSGYNRTYSFSELKRTLRKAGFTEFKRMTSLRNAMINVIAR